MVELRGSIVSILPTIEFVEATLEGMESIVNELA